MIEFRTKIGDLFESWFDFVYRHHYLVLLIVLLLISGLISQLPRIQVDTSIEGFLEKDNPDMVIYDDFREQFGRDDRIMVGIRARSVFDLDFLERFRHFHRTLEQDLPYLEDVESLVNARAVYGTEDELIIEDLFDTWPTTPADLQVIEYRASRNPLYRNLWLSSDHTFTMVSVKIRRYAEELTDSDILEAFDVAPQLAPAERDALELIDDKQSAEVVEELVKIIESQETEDFQIYLAGQPVLTHFLASAVMRDMQLFSALGVLTIAILLYVLFRTFTAVVPPILVVVLSLLSTLSCMAIAGKPIQLPTQVLPSFLLAVGVADSVHILAIFHQNLRSGMHKRAALKSAGRHAGLPILFTSITTAGGLLSFISSGMAPVATLGVYAPLGVLFAFLYTLTILPALITLLPTRTSHRADSETFSGNLLVLAGAMAIRRPRTVVLATFAMVVIAIYTSLSLEFSHNPMSWFPDNYPLRRDTQVIDEAMAGTMTMEILIDKTTENAFHDPENLRGLERIAQEVENLEGSAISVGQSLSIVDVLKEIHQGLNGNRPEAYELPDSRELISQELLLFENSGSEDLEELTDSRFSKARITLIVNWNDALLYVPFVAAVKQIAEQHFASEQITITGLLPMLASTFSILIRSMSISFALALIIIVPLIMLLVGSIKTGSLAMGPNILPILICLGLMGFLALPIDAFTMLIGGVAIGLVVDDSIHFLHHFKHHYDESNDIGYSVEQTLRTTGRAMLFTTVVLVCGFCTFAISSMENLVRFGLLTSLTISLALLADVLLLPALISLWYGSAVRQE